MVCPKCETDSIRLTEVSEYVLGKGKKVECSSCHAVFFFQRNSSDYKRGPHGELLSSRMKSMNKKERRKIRKQRKVQGIE